MIIQESCNKVQNSPLLEQNENNKEEDSFWNDLELFVADLNTNQSSFEGTKSKQQVIVDEIMV